MGRDGVLGAQELVAAGGTIYAQDAETSAVWGMPGAVAKAGLAGLIASPHRLQARRSRRRQAAPLFAAARIGATPWKPAKPRTRSSPNCLPPATGQPPATESRRWRVTIRRSAACSANMASAMSISWCALLAPPCRAPAPKAPIWPRKWSMALLNNETYFFRDKPTFDQLPHEILPELARRRAGVKRLSIWSAGCSTGQEVYSLAMLFAEQRERWRGWTIEILGTDVSHRAINAARSGLYSQFEVQRGLPVTQMLRYFDETARGWQVRQDARQMVHFRQHNILGPHPGAPAFRSGAVPQRAALFRTHHPPDRVRPARQCFVARRIPDARRRRDRDRPDRPLSAGADPHQLFRAAVPRARAAAPARGLSGPGPPPPPRPFR